jgi:hypothetical protein
MTTTKKTVDLSWHCNQCTFNNKDKHAKCQMCEEKRPKKRPGLSTKLIPTKKVAKVSLESTLEGKDPDALQHVLEAESEHADGETAIITEIRTLDSELRTTKKRSEKRAKVSLESNLDLGNDLSRVSLDLSSLPIVPRKNKLSSKQKQPHQTMEPRLLSLTDRVSLDHVRKPTWDEKKLIEERERTQKLDVVSSFNCSMSSGINDDFDNNGLLSQRGRITSTESMEVETCQTISEQETISALLEKIARLQQQIKEPNELNNANQVNHNGRLSWSFNKDDPVPDDIHQFGQKRELSWAFPKNGPVPANVVDELYKQLKLSLKVSREQFSKAVNDIPAMSQHVVVGSDPSVNSGLVEIIKEEFENESILFATDSPIANANGPHINAFVMDSHVLSTNDCIVTSSNGMIANKPWRAVDRLQQYLTAYMGGSRVAISAVLPLLLSVSITSNPDDPSLLILDGQPAHAREGRDKSIKIMNSGVARISKFSMLYALRTCNVGLVLGDDAKKTLLGEGS